MTDLNKLFGLTPEPQEQADLDYAKGYEHGVIAAKIFIDKIVAGSSAVGEPLSVAFYKGIVDAMRSELNEDLPNV